MNRKLKMLFGTFVMSVFSFALVSAQTVQDGIANLEAERLKEAKEIFTKLAEGSPSPENLFHLGYFYVRTNELDEAQKAFEKGAQLDEKNYLNTVGLGAVALGKGDRTKAKELFDNAEKKSKGKDAVILYRIAEAYTLFEKTNDPAEAIRLADAAVKRDKGLANAYLVKGDALMIRNEGGAAVTAYEYALTALPEYPLANNRIGQIYLRGKNYNLALEYYKKAIDKDPEFAPAYKDLAELYFFARKWKLAAENFDLYMKKSGNTDPKTVLRASQFAFTADDYSRSLELLESIKGKINDPITLRMYGWSYFKTNDMDQAIKNLEEFIKVAPEKVISDDYKFLGRAYNKMASDGKEYDPKGMDLILKGADLDTSKADAAVTYKEIAGIYFKDKNYPEAINAFKKGISLDTAKAVTNDYYSLGISYIQSGSAVSAQITPGVADSVKLAETKLELFLKADSAFAKVTQLVPTWPFGYYWRGSALYNAYDRQENIDKGISAPHFEKFVEVGEKEGNVAKSYFKIAYSYLAFYYQSSVKDEEKAKDYWTKLLAVDPDNQAAKEALGLAQPAAAQPAAATKKK
jgi:tetratricopeptide (TPR) repeat protein